MLLADDYYSGPIELIDGLIDVTKKAILAQIEWNETFQVTLTHSFLSRVVNCLLSASDLCVVC